MQHATPVHCLERVCDSNRGSQCRPWTHAGTHATPKVAFLEILHHQPGVIVTHSNIVKLHDAGMLNTLDDFVFLQKASERVVQIVLILVLSRTTFSATNAPAASLSARYKSEIGPVAIRRMHRYLG